MNSEVDQLFVLLVLTTLLLSLMPLCALAQYDFNSDGIDELLHVAQTEEGVIQWQVLDPITDENSILGYLGQAGDQLAVGNWLEAGEPSIGVIGQGGAGGATVEHSRFSLQVPINAANQDFAALFYLQRGDRASIISSADLDGNGLSEVAVVRRGHSKRAQWHLTLNPFDSKQSKKSRVVFGTGADQPFTFYFRGSKESLARLQIRQNSRRAITVWHCHLPCKRQRRLRFSQDLVDSQDFQLQVLRGGSQSGGTPIAIRDYLVFISDTENEQELI